MLNVMSHREQACSHIVFASVTSSAASLFHTGWAFDLNPSPTRRIFIIVAKQE
jgi:hypothetical protein